MAIFINQKSRVLVQGITGRDGSFHAQQMKAYGTQVVGGVTPGKGGSQVAGIPVFNTVEEAVGATGADVSVVYVPPAFAVDAIYEAVDAGIGLVVCITEGLPANDMMKVYPYVKARGARLIGPNCPGLISVDQCKIGIMPATIVKKGNVGVVSRSGTLTYEAIWALTLAGMGQTTCIGIGGDQVIGTTFIDCLEAFEADPATRGVVMIGEIGGSDEEEAAAFIKKRMTKPVVAFIAGRSAPPGKRMGHAGAIISGGSGTAEGKVAALTAAGVPVAGSPTEIPALLRDLMARRAGKARSAARPAAKPASRAGTKIRTTSGRASAARAARPAAKANKKPHAAKKTGTKARKKAPAGRRK
ncbi:MAG: succinate--CoA ligase subunit alpha [candidate division Zixibacteria bacterium]|nr:succinate--CoA ligase subunit alpha [candidate division Zixibacteria bacterium]